MDQRIQHRHSLCTTYTTFQMNLHTRWNHHIVWTPKKEKWLFLFQYSEFRVILRHSSAKIRAHATDLKVGLHESRSDSLFTAGGFGVPGSKLLETLAILTFTMSKMCLKLNKISILSISENGKIKNNSLKTILNNLKISQSSTC